MRRDLISLQTEKVLGAVILDGDRPRFERYAEEVFRLDRERLGDSEAARGLIESGWSNGQTLYLGPVQL